MWQENTSIKRRGVASTAGLCGSCTVILEAANVLKGE
jgi:hypothetical protein